MKLIKHAEVYAPEYLGKKDVFVAGGKICRIADSIDLPETFRAAIIDGTGKKLLPGFIDSHVHVTGGGGEGGFINRTPEATLSGLTRHGITTVVGCLGTDGFARNTATLVAKLKSLKAQGISAYGYTGSYQVPARTLTDSITEDIMMIEELIGTGEVAISDHRSSQPTFEEFARLCADTRLGGILSGKAGIINVHMGGSDRFMDLILRVIRETEIPATQFLPTHINRSQALLDSAAEYIALGGTVDFTGNENIDYWEKVKGEVRVCYGIRDLLERGVSSDRFTISSDGQGSLPLYTADGEFLGIGIGQSSCLLKEIRECVNLAGIPLETAAKAITSNPADVLGLHQKGRISEGLDADFCLLTDDLMIDTVIAMGNIMVKNGVPVVKGPFEN